VAKTLSKKHGRITVDVTADDVAQALKKASGKCAVAVALARTLPNAHHIEVDIQTVRWSDETGRHVYLTPWAVQGYIVAFDGGDEIHPFRFRLDDAHHRVEVRQRPRTAAAKAKDAAANRVKTAQKRAAKVEKAAAVDQATPTQVEQAKAQLDEAGAELAGVKAAYAGQPWLEANKSDATRRPPPMARTGRRAYGQRVLRINQQG
jgi:hypothetical protein